LIAKPERRFKSVEIITKLFVGIISFGSSPMACDPIAGHDLLILEVPRSLLWTRDQPVAETSTCTIHNTHDRHPCPSVGFEPTVSAGERPQTHALDRAATGVDWSHHRYKILNWSVRLFAFRL